MIIYLVNNYDLENPKLLEYTEEDILKEYWDFWVKQLKSLGRENLISRERCIEDWVVCNWAWKKSNGI